MCERLDKIDKQFEEIMQRLDTMTEEFHQEMCNLRKQIAFQTKWMVGTMIALTGVVLAAVKILFL